MRKLLKRWYVWLGLVLLLGLAGSVALILANPSRITQENFDRILGAVGQTRSL
jgi:4-amino-4-deoxy-L-arabinose transferase-like glycosyltransferase